ncbi:putative Ribbon-helix-helix protein [Limnobacter sp. 130]|uniref:hypothetical protein n=1 Tax=Limnobacter sp. 130 TaxID=2653147 RepID=UPI0012EF4ECB|nr:hypothetical protein [Limnobacter sp. 130]VWX32817.1 putative Ribbon-helix-helix protein [Limnobacter sp. 130]
MQQEIRTIRFRDKNATSIKLSTTTWEAIELVASNQGMKWTDWIRAVLAETDDQDNKTEAVRNALIDTMLTVRIFSERACGVDHWENHPIMQGASPMDDTDFDDYINTAQQVDGENDLLGFKLYFGTDRDGRPFVGIRNGHRDGEHVAIAFN